MKNVFKTGDTKTFLRKIKPEDTAAFDAGQVHPVYGTFALARDAEWACRLFVLDMKEADEEGIGTFITVKHIAPAMVGEEVRFDATVLMIEKNSIICAYHAYCGERLIAEGETGQKILKKDRIEKMFEDIKGNK